MGEFKPDYWRSLRRMSTRLMSDTLIFNDHIIFSSIDIKLPKLFNRHGVIINHHQYFFPVLLLQADSLHQGPATFSLHRLAGQDGLFG